MTNTTLNAGWTNFYREIARGDCALQFTYTLDSASTASVPRMLLRFQPETGTSDYYDLYFQETDAKLARIVGGSWSQVAFNSAADSDPDTAYTAQIRVDGDVVSVWRSEGSGAAELVFEERDLPLLADARLRFYVAPDTKLIVDDITYAVVEPEHTEYRYNDANELENFVTNIAPAEKFTYDEWGRTITKSRVNGATTYEAVYMYRYGDKLKRVDSTFANEKDVAYVCDGFGKRRIKSVDPDGSPEKTLYRWRGWSVLAEYGEYTGQGGEWNTFGERTRTYLGASEVLGSNPQTGTYHYALTDHLGSVRQMRGQDKTLLARHAYYPYGTTLHTAGLPLNRGFTGHQWEPETGQYFAPFRYYSPSAGRWTMRDPIGYAGGLNMYAYVGANPVSYSDYYGLDRQVCFFIHSWIRVDTYDDLGNKNGKKDLHFSPKGWTAIDPEYTRYPAWVHWTIPSTKEEDEKLLDLWRYLKDDKDHQIKYFDIEKMSWYPCWAATCQFAKHGCKEKKEISPRCGGNFCVIKDTLILTSDGLCPIQSLEKGDSVIVYDTDEGRIKEIRIVSLIQSVGFQKMLKVHFENDTLCITPGHKLWTSEKKPIKARMLNETIPIKGKNEDLYMKMCQEYSFYGAVYNLAFDRESIFYYVGESNIPIRAFGKE